MQYRRREEEHAAVSPSPKLRALNRLESGPDPYRSNRGEGSGRSPLPQRNLSPMKVDGARRDLHLSGPRRSTRVRSRSPPADQMRKRSHFDDGAGHRSASPPPLGLRSLYPLSKSSDYVGVDGDENLDAKRVYLGREKDLIGTRLGSGQGVVDQRFVRNENEVGSSYRSIPDMGVSVSSQGSGHLPHPSSRDVPAGRFEHESDMGVSVTSGYEEGSRHLPPLPSRDVPVGRFEHERLQHREQLPVDKIPITESHSGADKAIYRSRDVTYSSVSPSYAKDFAGAPHLRDYGNSSTERAKSDYLCSRGEGTCLPTSYDLLRSDTKLAEGVGFSGHGQRPFMDTTKGSDIGQSNMSCHQQCEYSPTRTEHVDYFNSRQAREAQDEHLYQFDDICRRVSPHGPVTQDEHLYQEDDIPRRVAPYGRATHEHLYQDGDIPRRVAPRGQTRVTQDEHLYQNDDIPRRVAPRGQTRVTQDEHLYQDDDIPRRIAPHGRATQDEHLYRDDYIPRTRATQDEYLYQYDNIPRRAAPQDGHLYQYDDMPRRVAPHGRLEYEQAVMEYDNRELPRHYISHSDLDRTGKSEDSYGNPRRGIMHEHPASQVPTYADYHETRRTPIAAMQGEAYQHSGYNHHEIGKRMPSDNEFSYPDAPEDGQISVLRPEYESRRDGGLGLQQGRYQSSPLSKYNSETYRQAVRAQEMDQNIHGHSDILLKRKYNSNQKIDERDLRTMKSRKWYADEEFQDFYESGEWVHDENVNKLYSSDNVGFNHKIYRKYKNEYSELENGDFSSNRWISPQDSMGHVHGQFRFQKYSNQNTRHHSKSSSSNWYKSQQFSKRNAIQKQPKGWKKYHGYDENKYTTNDESYEDLVVAAESELTEGSNEFIQMVHENFLIYSKNLNLNLSVQRRYRNQGKAGSLYCIVCGRSASKEFMDTQRLVTHAFMSHKVGLRAKHLGLHKAICVLMGWDTVAPQDTVTWVPQVLPHADALAQKEDLILWPPMVIIHNISMSDDNPQNWKVVSMETIEAFIRGKGFVRGRIKLCLGKPADQSTILVKFLGTFVGLGDAERIHKYLSDNNRGRADYERVKSEGIKSCNEQEGDQGDKVESILYGYVAIAEDLDKLDLNSKKWSLVKSRKEIDDLDKDPVKTDERR